MSEEVKIIKEIQSDAVEATVLGQRVAAPLKYTPSILVRVPRSENRLIYDIHDDNLPFDGYDVWHAYEISFLDASGIPRMCVGKIKYSCNSAYIVESKSLKLYLNGFNMSRFSSHVEVCSIITNDLTKLLETKVAVSLIEDRGIGIGCNIGKMDIFKDHLNVINLERLDVINPSHFTETPEVLEFIVADTVERYHDDTIAIKIPFLRSNCKITHQPDFGTAFIMMRNCADNKQADIASIVEYIISFRGESHFHEEVCEMIFKRLLDKYNPLELKVTCMYTRRGGIDICPTRWTKRSIVHEPELLNMEQLEARTINQ